MRKLLYANNKNGVINQMEIWKQIKDYPYEVSNLGRIKSQK